MKRQIAAYMLLIVAAVPFGLLCGPRLAQAQTQPAIRIAVQAGFEDAYRVGEWFPVSVNMTNNGADIQGVLDWSFPGQPDEQTFQRAIDLPHGANKRVTLAVLARGFARQGRITLLEKGAPLASQDVSLNPIDTGGFLIGVISSDPGLLNSLNALQIGSASRALVRHMNLTAIPEQTTALRGLNVLFLHDIDSGALSKEQRAALELWVRLGGQLVVSGGLNGQKAARGLADLLPADVGSAIVQGDLTALARLAGVSVLPQPALAPLSDARPRVGADALRGGGGLFNRWRLGNGTVTFSAFDLATLRGWAGEVALWGKLLTPSVSVSLGMTAHLSPANVMQGVLQLPGQELPSTATLFLFLLMYVLVIGPLNYIVLRRWRRLEWAWISVPLIVFLFAGGLYIVGYRLRGNMMQLDQVAVVQGDEGQTRGFATAFVNLFSPRRTTVTLAFPAEALVSEMGSGSELPASPALSNDTGVMVPGVLLDVAASRTFVAETARDIPVRIQSSVQDNGSSVGGEVRNIGSSSLEDALIVHNGAFQPLGTLVPGVVGHVMLNYSTNNFPSETKLTETGRYNRQQVLHMLFSSNAGGAFYGTNSNEGMLDPKGTYLLAWLNEPSVPLQIDGQMVPQGGVTLFVIRLRS